MPRDERDSARDDDGRPSDDRDSPTTYGALTPEDALALVGNEVRAAILRALSDARGGEGSPPALSFSELRSRVDADVDSSQFNYHLQQLVGHFVERRAEGNAQLVEEFGRQGEEGYALRPEGTTLIRTIRAGTFVGEGSLPPFETGLDCYFCDTPVEATYNNWIFKLQCPECAYLYDYNLTPPGVVTDDEQAVLSRVSEYNRHVRSAFARGVCPYCASAVSKQFLRPPATNYPRGDLREAFVHRSCDHCGNMDYLTVGETLLQDPGLISFCHERGLDVTATPIWELEFAATDREVTVRSTDPWEIALGVTVEDDALELVVDEELAVVERKRS